MLLPMLAVLALIIVFPSIVLFLPSMISPEFLAVAWPAAETGAA